MSIFLLVFVTVMTAPLVVIWVFGLDRGIRLMLDEIFTMIIVCELIIVGAALHQLLLKRNLISALSLVLTAVLIAPLVMEVFGLEYSVSLMLDELIAMLIGCALIIVAVALRPLLPKRKRADRDGADR